MSTANGRTFEDFVPISHDRALVTTGPELTALDRIERVAYRVREGKVETWGPETLVMGEHLRLGGLFGGRLVYSDRASGVVGWDAPSPTAHQPFEHEGALYYTDDEPWPRIYREGMLFLGHFGDMVQVGNPCWAGGAMYFECRSDPDPCRPDLWEIWRLDRDGPRFVVRGANPASYGDWLFWGEWNGRGFEYRCANRSELG